jgi:uncharacterized protein YkwD
MPEHHHAITIRARPRRALAALVLLTVGCLALPASTAPLPAADPRAAAANDVRRAGCMRFPGLDDALRPEPRLMAAAAQMRLGRSLEVALAEAAYQATTATAVRVHARNVQGRTEGDALRNALAARFCAQLTNAEFQEIGTVHDGEDLWVVLGAPFAPPRRERAQAMETRVLELVNADRVRGRSCGGTYFEPTAPLVRSAPLQRAAMLHARDLVRLGTLSHRGSDGSRPSDRISREDYAWSSVGENLASGVTRPEELVEGWFGSPVHCANLMNPRFTEMGIAYVTSDDGAGEIYWVQEFGAPRGSR